MATVSPEAIERLEALLATGPPGPRRRMMIIVNPYATTVSDRLKRLVVYALRGSYDVTAIDTEARNHATELCRQAADERYDVVVAFGGDGTVNEAANGLAGSETALTCLPGGRTNVYCRMLGIPTDVVDATGGHSVYTYDSSHRILTMRSPKYYGDTTTVPSGVNSTPGTARRNAVSASWPRARISVSAVSCSSRPVARGKPASSSSIASTVSSGPSKAVMVRSQFIRTPSRSASSASSSCAGIRSLVRR